MINPVWLTTFCTLVDIGHFTLTAKKLFMTQSSVSQHINKLESQLGTHLLAREGKSFTLTEAGQQLYQQGQALLLSLEELEQSIKEDNEFEGVIKVTSPGSIGLKLYSHLLGLQQKYPKLIIDYAFAPNKTIEKSIIDRQCDFALMTELSKLDKIISQKIAVEQLVLITPAHVQHLTWDTLIALGFISHPDASYHGQLLLSQNFSEFEHINQFEHKGFSNHIGLICLPVSHGFGFTVLPLHAAKNFAEQHLICIHSLNIPVYETVYFCMHSQRLVNQRTKQVRASIIKYLSE
jgi:DNA-binding transcriptional LysR family regulator